MVAEIARLYGWAYGKAYARLETAFARRQLTRLKRAGHQPYYLAHQVEALFGPPPSLRVINGGDAPVKATYEGRSEYETRRGVAA